MKTREDQSTPSDMQKQPIPNFHRSSGRVKETSWLLRDLPKRHKRPCTTARSAEPKRLESPGSSARLHRGDGKSQRDGLRALAPRSPPLPAKSRPASDPR